MKDAAATADQKRSEMLVEYSALRDEILKREDMRQQMLTFAVLSAGTIMTLFSFDLAR